MASDLTVQTIRGPASGANANKVLIPTGQTLTLEDKLAYANLPAGSIVQIVTNTITPQLISHSTGSFAEVTTSYRTSITPRFATSKLLLQFTCLHGGNNQGNIMTCKFFDVTNNTDIHSGYSMGSRSMGHGSIRQSDNDLNDRDNLVLTASINANNTNARTYSIYSFNESSSTHYWNATGTDNSGCSFTIPLFTIMEIAQ